MHSVFVMDVEGSLVEEPFVPKQRDNPPEDELTYAKKLATDIEEEGMRRGVFAKEGLPVQDQLLIDETLKEDIHFRM